MKDDACTALSVDPEGASYLKGNAEGGGASKGAPLIAGGTGSQT